MAPDRAPHLVLVGSMGAGKSTVGRLLADRSGRPFVDLDEEVEARTAAPVAAIFAERGEVGFRAAEGEALAEVLSRAAPLVVATGGGVVLDPANRDRLRESGATVVWLRAAPGTLAHRVGDGEGRPLLHGDVQERLEALAGERDGLYRAVATTAIDTDHLPAGEVADRIRSQIAAEQQDPHPLGEGRR